LAISKASTFTKGKAALGSVRSYAETCANVAEMCKKSHEAEEWKRVAEGLSKLAESCPER
jgi:hypothetical protein